MWGTMIRYVSRGVLLATLALVGTSGWAAEQPKPAFAQPEVLKAAMAINLTDEQKPQFQAALTDFVTGRMDAIKKLMSKRNQTNLPRKIKGRTNALLKKMDKSMGAFLTEEQLPAYENYRALLKANLRGM